MKESLQNYLIKTKEEKTKDVFYKYFPQITKKTT